MRDDAKAWRTAREQLWLITGAQLAACGFSREAIRHRLRIGRLWRVYPGVFAVGHYDMTRERRWMAAVLACGHDALLGRMCAACHWRIWEKPPPLMPQVLIPDDHGRRGPRGVDLRRAPTLRPSDVVIHLGIPTTSIPRTICDNAHTLDDGGVTSMIRQAQRVHRITLTSLRAYVDTHPTASHRHRRVSRVLDVYSPATALTQTEREALPMDLCKQHGIPLPQPQLEIGEYRADFAWPQYGLVVELDDRESHEGAIAFGADLVRQRKLEAAGYRVLRFTVAELLTQPEMVADHIRIALDAGRSTHR